MEWRSRGYLPHYDGANTVQHIVFGLADAAPVKVARLAAQTAIWERQAAYDTVLDAGHGDRTLANPRAAAIVQQALMYFDIERYFLLAWCVMPTHVRVLIEIREAWPMAKVVHAWKSFTANAVNKRLGRTGRLWAREYFDRTVRDDNHFGAVRDYIEYNPVAARLVSVQSTWPWSSASLDGPL